MPRKQKKHHFIYKTINVINGKLGVGETVDIKKRITGGYVNKTKTLKYDGSLIIRSMQELAVSQGNYLKFGVIWAQSCRTDDSRILESQWVEELQSRGYEMLNTTRSVKRKHNQRYDSIIIDYDAVDRAVAMINNFVGSTPTAILDIQPKSYLEF